ncbi:hypothetical protein EVAR_96327_1 [Eumeta japonica]|uniref:Uncharacterized protein n=1 Tax=Eumeta variegata TaxID=151549 RepID=A0A4C1VZ20_EUMVA|nr:hypothetical protein EVAR_96327_1 [Eumeta japonica]
MPSKRQVLSFVISIFDPLDRDARTWLDWLREIRELTTLAIPRYYELETRTVELHVFGDASEQAYAAVAYWREVRADSSVHIALVAEKARVASNKPISIPRLELQAALLTCRLASTVIKEHDEIKVSRRVMWTDTKTVLQWIRSNPQNYKPYVAHHLAEIDERSKVNDWRWVNSADNPADDALRDNTPYRSKNDRWFTGPAFLKAPECEWPVDKNLSRSDESDDELRPETVCVVTQPGEVIDVYRFSSWTRLIRSLASALLFVKKCRRQQVGALTVSNLREAGMLLVKCSQARKFSCNTATIKQGRPLLTTSRLQHSTPHSQTTYSESVDECATNPHSPPKRNIPSFWTGATERRSCWSTSITARLVTETTRASRPLSTVSSAARTASPTQKGDLPPARVDGGHRPFTYCGMDYFGPMEVTIGRRHEKRWECCSRVSRHARPNNLELEDFICRDRSAWDAVGVIALWMPQGGHLAIGNHVEV